MRTASAINLHIEHVVIDEAVHRAGPEAVRAALAAQLPGLLAEHGGGAGVSRADSASLSRRTAGHVAARLPSPSPTARK